MKLCSLLDQTKVRAKVKVARLSRADEEGEMSTLQKMIAELRELDASEWDHVGGSYGSSEQTATSTYSPVNVNGYMMTLRDDETPDSVPD